MVRKPPVDDVDDGDMSISAPKETAAGIPGVAAGLAAGLRQMGVRRTALTLLRVNQVGGFDCPGCAWPEPVPNDRAHAEFCENGAKAVAEEATRRRITRKLFAEHAIAVLAQRSDHWLGQQGRLTEPMVRREGADHYTPIAWDEAFALVAERVRGLSSPDEAIF